jgi:uncharacterized protein YgbK (DUF1537 family)
MGKALSGAGLMRPLIAAIADDYTGASDLANSWRRAGLRTVQAIGIPHEPPAGDYDALVISLKIRSVPAEQAVAAALDAYRYLAALGTRHVIYKICSTFDSTAQGNIGPVTDALLAAANAPWAIINSASPENGRTIYQGHLFVGTALLSDSPLRHHPLNPMTDSSLLGLFAQQGSAQVGLLPHGELVKPDGGVAALETLVQRGARAIVADAISPECLPIVGRLALGSPVSVGAAGLGLGLAQALLDGRPGHANRDDALRSDGNGLVLVGSCSSQTLKQLDHARGVMPVLQIDVEALMTGAFDPEAFAAQVRTLLQESSVVVAISDEPRRVAELQQRYGQQRLSIAAEDCIATIAERFVTSGLHKLVVAGGETSGAVIDRLGLQLLEVGDEIDPGVPALMARRADGSSLHLALKSGNFGSDDFFAKALNAL